MAGIKLAVHVAIIKTFAPDCNPTSTQFEERGLSLRRDGADAERGYSASLHAMVGTAGRLSAEMILRYETE